MIDNGIWDKGFIWNPSNCDCWSNKLCDIGQYLDYANCRCRKVLISKLVEECCENIDRNELIYNRTVNNYGKIYNSYTVCIALFAIAFLIIIGIINAYFYFCVNTFNTS